MSKMTQSPNFQGLGGVTTKKGNYSIDDEIGSPKSGWERFKAKFSGDTFGNKLLKVLAAFGVARFVLWLAYVIWFNDNSISVNADIDFLVKTLCVSLVAGGILAAVDAVFQSPGKATAIAYLIFIFTTVATHYFAKPYYKDGKSTVYVNSRTGDIYQNAYADVKHDPKTNRDYFLHPRSNDTCWNESPKTNSDVVDLLKSKNRKKTDVPIGKVLYSVSGSPYTFNLKAGQTLNHWITMQQDRTVDISLSSDNYDYYIIYSETEQYKDGPGVTIPDHNPSKFYLKAGNTDQVITMNLSQR